MASFWYIIPALLAIAQAGPSIQNGQCGGVIELDSGSLTYPGELRSVIPGQICVWTIVLPKTQVFQYKLPEFNIPGIIECGAGFLNTVSLSASPEVQKICNENLNSEATYTVQGNVLTLIFGTNENMNTAGVTFTIEWTGLEVDPNSGSHTLTFTTSSSGIIQYPIQGEYETNAINLWLIQPTVEVNQTEITFEPQANGFESCSSEDSCVECDALMIFQIDPKGNFIDDNGHRLCGEREGGTFTIAGSTFIALFRSNEIEEPGVGYGYTLIWKGGLDITNPPTPTSTPTTTTTSTTTPTPTTITTEDPNPPFPTITTCGGILLANRGRIEYKVNETYGNSERCAWIIRGPDPRLSLYLRKIQSGFELGRDYLSIFAFDDWDSESTIMGKTTNGEEEHYMSGVAAVVVFTSDAGGTGQGFELEYNFNGTEFTGARVTDDFFSSDIEGSVTIGGPGSNDHYGNYRNTIMVMSRNNTFYSDIGWTATIHMYEMEIYPGLDPCHYDGVRVYSVAEDSLSYVGKYCGYSDTLGPFLARNLYIFVVNTDSVVDDGGFRIDWGLR